MGNLMVPLACHVDRASRKETNCALVWLWMLRSSSSPRAVGREAPVGVVREVSGLRPGGFLDDGSGARARVVEPHDPGPAGTVASPGRLGRWIDGEKHRTFLEQCQRTGLPLAVLLLVLEEGPPGGVTAPELPAGVAEGWHVLAGLDDGEVDVIATARDQRRPVTP